MLTANQLDALPGPILDLYEDYMQSVLNDIARRLAGLDFARPTAAWQMQRLTESGKVYEAALDELSKLTGRSEAELRRMFERAGVYAMRFDDAIYRAAGLNPLPLNLSPAMAHALAAGLRKTQGIMHNLTMSTAISGQDAFVRAADLAYMQITGGAFDYNAAIRSAVKRAAAEGLTVIDYATGRRDQLDVAMRRTVLTGVNQTVGNLQIARADEMGVDLVQTSAHVGARNKGTGPANHESWQGRIFSRSGATGKYPNFVEVTGYGTGPGLCGWNCRHSFYPYLEGISENAYKQADLDSFAGKTVTYAGKEMGFYDATQQQRAIERKIRYWKRQEGALKAAGLDASQESAKVKEWQAQMRGFVRQTGLRRQYERERIVTVVKPKAGPTSSAGPQLADIRALQQDGVLQIGNLNQDIVSGWTEQTDDNLAIVLTGKQRIHYLGSHKEMDRYEQHLFASVLDPDEVHRNKKDRMMALFYKKYDETHYLRTAVLMQQTPGELKHSVISYRLARPDEVERGREAGRVIWRK